MESVFAQIRSIPKNSNRYFSISLTACCSNPWSTVFDACNSHSNRAFAVYAVNLLRSNIPDGASILAKNARPHILTALKRLYFLKPNLCLLIRQPQLQLFSRILEIIFRGIPQSLAALAGQCIQIDILSLSFITRLHKSNPQVGDTLIFFGGRTTPAQNAELPPHSGARAHLTCDTDGSTRFPAVYKAPAERRYPCGPADNLC